MQPEHSDPRVGARCFHFGRFVLDESTGELRRDEIPVALRIQAVRILGLLLRERGRLVPRESIRQEIWGPDVHVEFDQGLNDCVRAIRAALGDDAREPRFVETLPRRGYRFIGEVEEAPVPAPPAPGRAWPRRLAVGLVIGLAGLLVASAARPDVPRLPSLRERVRIAVMPFQELSPEGDPYFGDGLTEELIATLGSLHPERLGVIARTTAREYARQRHDVASLAASLDVDFVLEGSVRRQKDRARITAELIDARAQTLVWADAWDGDLRDILELQEDVARVVARAVRVSVRPDVEARLTRVRRVDPEAHRLYLEGRSYFNRMDVLSLRRSVELYHQALALQDDHALAWAALAESYVMLGDLTAMEPADVARLSREAVARALAIDETLAPAYVARGVVLGMYEQRWELAEQSFEQAIALNPAYPSARNWYAQLLRARGRVDAAVEEARMAVEMDPLSGINGVNLGFALFTRGDQHQALETFLGVLEVEPGYPPALLGLGMVQAALGRTEEAYASLELAAGAARGSALFDASLAYTCATSGREVRAREILARMERARPRSAFLIAVVHAGLGQTDAAFDWLEAAIGEHDPRARFIAADDRLAPLRSDPRFRGLVERFRLLQPDPPA